MQARELEIPRLTDDIAKHAEYIIKTMYNKPYKADQVSPDGIFRMHHGGQHVSRVAINVNIFANAYRAFGDKDALNLTENDLKFLQIAALFHDAAREGEGKDIWDEDSAKLCYDYLLKLGAPEETARNILEAIAYKDDYSRPRTIFAKLIHDADSLDITRVRELYDGTYLDFYKEIAKNNQHALDVLGFIIAEARGLIALQGDKCAAWDTEIKLQYQPHDICFKKILSDIQTDPRFSHLMHLYNGNKLASPEAIPILLNTLLPRRNSGFNAGTRPQEVTAEMLTNAMSESALFIRSISFPASQSDKPGEVRAALEFRKLMRELGIATRKGSLFKEGNKIRSCSMAGFGATSPANVGMLLALNSDDIDDVHLVNANTGFGKKKDLKIKTDKKDIPVKLKELSDKQKLGGSAINVDGINKRHNEIIAHLRRHNLKAFYFSNEQVSYGAATSDAKIKLDVIYLQLQYAQFTNTQPLKIFSYSETFNTIQAFVYDEKLILELWRDHLTESALQKDGTRDFVLYDDRMAELIKYYNPELKLKLLTIIDAVNYQTREIYSDFLENPSKQKVNLLLAANNPLIFLDKALLLKNYKKLCDFTISLMNSANISTEDKLVMMRNTLDVVKMVEDRRQLEAMMPHLEKLIRLKISEFEVNYDSVSRLEQFLKLSGVNDATIYAQEIRQFGHKFVEYCLSEAHQESCWDVSRLKPYMHEMDFNTMMRPLVEGARNDLPATPQDENLNHWVQYIDTMPSVLKVLTRDSAITQLFLEDITKMLENFDKALKYPGLPDKVADSTAYILEFRKKLFTNPSWNEFINKDNSKEKPELK